MFSTATGWRTWQMTPRHAWVKRPAFIEAEWRTPFSSAVSALMPPRPGGAASNTPGLEPGAVPAASMWNRIRCRLTATRTGLNRGGQVFASDRDFVVPTESARAGKSAPE
jgi:hypothetical protein